MSLQTRVRDLTLRIAQEFNSTKSSLDGKVNISQGVNDGYVRTDSSGNIIVVSESHVPSAPQDTNKYLLQNNTWVQYTPVSSLDWGQIDNKPTEFTPESHNHNDLYYTKTEVDTSLSGKANLTHDHNDLYYTKAEVDTSLSGKENSFTKNTAFNKNFGTVAGTVSEGNHNHNSIYYTKTEVTTLLSNKSNVGHNHNTIYYTRPEVDTLLSSSNLGTSHNHDTFYYRKPEVDTLLSGKSNTVHNHDDRYYLKSEVDVFISGKSDINHNHDDRYYTEAEVDTLISNAVSGITTLMTPSGGIPVILSEGKSFGKFINGDTIPENLNLLEVVTQAVTEVIPAEFILPTANLITSVDLDIEREVGEPLPIDLEAIFVQNDAGAVNNYKITKNGVELLNSNSTNTFNDSNFVVIKGNTSYVTTISYDAGSGSKPNSIGVPEPNNIQAGDAISEPITITGYNPIFYGRGNTALTTGQDIRLNYTKMLDINIQNITINTGTSDTVYQFWIPSDRTVESIIDLDALNIDITESYTPSSVNGVGADGVSISGTLYTSVNGAPYLTNHRHLITLS